MRNDDCRGCRFACSGSKSATQPLATALKQRSGSSHQRKSRTWSWFEEIEAVCDMNTAKNLHRMMRADMKNPTGGRGQAKPYAVVLTDISTSGWHPTWLRGDLLAHGPEIGSCSVLKFRADG